MKMLQLNFHFCLPYGGLWPLQHLYAASLHQSSLSAVFPLPLVSDENSEFLWGPVHQPTACIWLGFNQPLWLWCHGCGGVSHHTPLCKAMLGLLKPWLGITWRACGHGSGCLWHIFYLGLFILIDVLTVGFGYMSEWLETRWTWLNWSDIPLAGSSHRPVYLSYLYRHSLVLILSLVLNILVSSGLEKEVPCSSSNATNVIFYKAKHLTVSIFYPFVPLLLEVSVSSHELSGLSRMPRSMMLF